MAIISMQKIELVGLSSERGRILKLLHKIRCAEITGISKLENTNDYSDARLIDKYATKLNRLNFVFSFTKEMRNQAVKFNKHYSAIAKENEQFLLESGDTVKALAIYEVPKKPFSIGLPAVTYEKYEEISDKEADLLKVVDAIENANSKLIDIRSDLIRLNSTMEQLAPYTNIKAELSSFKDTRSTTIMLGVIPSNKSSMLTELKDSLTDIYIESYGYTKYEVVMVISSLDLKEEIITKLAEMDFIACGFDFDMTAEAKFEELKSQSSLLEKEKEDIVATVVCYDKFKSDFELLYEYYNVELKKAEADNQFKFTGSTFVMCAWVPLESAEELKAKLTKEFTVSVDLVEPAENEVVPTLTKNNSFVSPYEDITNMYSPPNQKEIDPNPFMAVFYFLFFGIMVSDAGYGIILSIIAFGMYKFAKPRKGEGKLVLVIGMGGISTFIWGIMFGGWFGMSLTPILFNPLEEPLAMLGMSLGLGVIQILFGMGIHAYALIKKGEWLDALCNIGGWYAVFLGLGLFAFSLVPNMESLSNIGVTLAIIGIVGVFVGGGLKSKKIVGKIFGGLGNLYGITGFLSDILSYSRLFGLGLATGVVGMVINQLASVALDLIPYGLGYIIVIPILIGGHVFNIGINTLGAYVHNSRLQYIEFFSRFYTGSGHQFVPFASQSKYIYIDK